MLLKLLLLVAVFAESPAYRCSNRLYRGQYLNVGEHLCSRSFSYRLWFDMTGRVQIGESFTRESYLKPPPSTLFVSDTSSLRPQYLTVTDGGDLILVDTNGVTYWRANVTGGTFLELQDSGVAVLFSLVGSTWSVLWKTLSMYSLRLVGGSTANVGRLEIFFNNAWGTVCDSTGSTFDAPDATAACRTLGYDSGQKTTVSTTASTGPIWMTNMMCMGTEDTFADCAFNVDDKTWGDTTECVHANDVAVTCSGSWSLGVMQPVAHACTDRLPVGKSLALNESLCAGANGEFFLRFLSRKGDTVAVMQEKRKRRWFIGAKKLVNPNAILQLDSDGILRIYGLVVNLSHPLFTENTTNAAYMELQDNGTVRIASDNGTTGWKRAPQAIVFEEQRNANDYPSHDIEFYKDLSLLECIDKCDQLNGYCKLAQHSDNIYWNSPTGNCIPGSRCCWLRYGVPWDYGLDRTYYVKTPGCAAGAGCYTQFNNTDNWGFDIAGADSFEASADACRQRCDNEPRCTNFVVRPSSGECWLKWRRINDSVVTQQADVYFRVSPPQNPANPVYKGCYADGNPRDLPVQVHDGYSTSVLLCSTLCSLMNYTYAGMQYTTQCFCGNSYSHYGVASGSPTCSFTCQGNAGDKCGQSSQNSIYSITPSTIVLPSRTPVPVNYTYRGCYIDGSPRDLPNKYYDGPTLTVEFCITLCAALDFTYAGLQYITQCFCSNSATRLYGLSSADSDCSSACSGNPQQKCGAGLRNSIYEISRPFTFPAASPVIPANVVYRGCYVDDTNARDLSFTAYSSWINSLTACVATCSALKYSVAGLQWDYCFCGNAFGTYGKAVETECLIPCTYNNKDRCGGFSRNSVYEIMRLVPADSNAVVLPPKACQSQLLVNGYLLPGERLCSPNGKHTLLLEKDGRLSIDQLPLDSASGRSAYLQFSASMHLLLRLTNGTMKWDQDVSTCFSPTNRPMKWLSITDAAAMQIVDDNGVPLWNHVKGCIGFVVRFPMETTFPNVSPLTDANNSTCVSNIPTTVFSFSSVTMNAVVTLTLVGQNLRCSPANGSGTSMFIIPTEPRVNNSWLPVGKTRHCQLLAGDSSVCRFQCLCEMATCDTVFLRRVDCADIHSSLCEVTIVI